MATSDTKQAKTKPAEPKQAGTGPSEDQQSEGLSYEQARDELASVVKRLEAGGLTLEQSLGLWERGERLAGVCGQLLEGARARLSAATADRSGGDGDEDDRPF